MTALSRPDGPTPPYQFMSASVKWGNSRGRIRHRGELFRIKPAVPHTRVVWQAPSIFGLCAPNRPQVVSSGTSCSTLAIWSIQRCMERVCWTIGACLASALRHGRLPAGTWVLGTRSTVYSSFYAVRWSLLGPGTLKYPDADGCKQYTGQFVHGKRHGHGILEFRNGSYFEGEFSDDKISGRGVFRFASGNR